MSTVEIWKKIKAILSATKLSDLTMRAVRIKIFSTHQVLFELFSGPQKKLIEITNISTSGVGLKRDQDTTWQALGQKLTGQLKIRHKYFRATLEVRHVTMGIVGCRYISSEPDLYKAIEEYLVYEITGLGLKKVGRQHLSNVDQGTPQWYVDSQGNELYIVERDGQVVRYHIVFLGNYVEWNEQAGIKVGIVLSDKKEDPINQKQAHVIKFSDTIPKEIENIVQRILLSVRDLDLKTKEQILKTLS